MDTDIDGLKKKVQDLKYQISKAEPAVTEAQKKTVAPDRIHSQLRQLPGQGSRRPRGQVSHLSAAAKAAAASARMSEALYLASELKQALGRLSKLIGTETETELVNRLDKEWQESNAAKKDIAALEKLKGDLATAEGQLQQKMQRREADMKEALRKVEVAEPASRIEPAEPSPQRRTDRRSKKS